MVRPAEKTKIVVICPAGARTGGPEALFQLENELLELGLNAQIWLIPTQIIVGIEKSLAAGRDLSNCGFSLFSDDFINDDYKKYKFQIFNGEISPDTVVVLPEVYAHWVKFFFFCKPVVWWLSVDNGFGALSKINLNVLRLQKTTHFFQSEYAAEFLSAIGLDGLPLFDYTVVPESQNRPLSLRPPALSINVGRKVIFSTHDFERELRKRLQDLEVTRIENLDRMEVYSVFQRSRVFVDFGNFPGNDRMYREAAALGCLVVVANAGGGREASYPISDGYRINLADIFTEGTFETLMDMMLCPADHDLFFSPLRSAIGREREVFRQQVRHGFLDATLTSVKSF